MVYPTGYSISGDTRFRETDHAQTLRSTIFFHFPFLQSAIGIDLRRRPYWLYTLKQRCIMVVNMSFLYVDDWTSTYSNYVHRLNIDLPVANKQIYTPYSSEHILTGCPFFLFSNTEFVVVMIMMMMTTTMTTTIMYTLCRIYMNQGPIRYIIYIIYICIHILIFSLLLIFLFYLHVYLAISDA